MGPGDTMGLELFGLACIVGLMSLRIWIQWGRQRSHASYTYDICLALAFCCNAYITSIDVWSSYRQTKLGPDPPNTELNKKMMDKEFLRAFFAVGVCYSIFLWLVKASFIALYFELSNHFVRKVRIALYCVTVYCIITFIANIVLKFLWCRPLKRNWSTGPDKCTFAIALPVNTCTTFFNITTDIALLTLFVYIVNTLQIQRREMLAAIFVGFIGTCTVIAAAVRYSVAYTSFKNSIASWKNTKTLLLWTNIEMGLVMLAVTLPAFRMLLRKKSRERETVGYSSSSRTAGDHFGVKAIGGDVQLVAVHSGSELTGNKRGFEDRRGSRPDVDIRTLTDAESFERSSGTEEGSVRGLCVRQVEGAPV